MQFNIAKNIVSKELFTQFYTLGLTRRLSILDNDLVGIFAWLAGIARVGRYFYIANLSTPATLEAFDTVTNQYVPSKKITAATDPDDAFLDNDQPNGLSYYNGILYALEYSTGFQNRIFRYDPIALVNKPGQIELYNNDRYELDGADGLAIDKDGTMYVVAPNNYEGITHVTKKPRLCIYGPPPESGFSGVRNSVKHYPRLEIPITGEEKGVAVNDDFVVTVGNDEIVRFYDKKNNYALVPERQFTLPPVIQDPQGCHLDGDILWLVTNSPKKVFAVSIAFINLPKTLSMMFNVLKFPATKTLDMKFVMDKYNIQKALNIKFRIFQKRIVPKSLSLKFNISKFPATKTLNLKFRLNSTRVKKTLKMLFGILQTERYQIISFPARTPQEIRFNND